MHRGRAGARRALVSSTLLDSATGLPLSMQVLSKQRHVLKLFNCENGTPGDPVIGRDGQQTEILLEVAEIPQSCESSEEGGHSPPFSGAVPARTFSTRSFSSKSSRRASAVRTSPQRLRLSTSPQRLPSAETLVRRVPSSGVVRQKQMREPEGGGFGPAKALVSQNIQMAINLVQTLDAVSLSSGDLLAGLSQLALCVGGWGGVRLFCRVRARSDIRI